MKKHHMASELVCVGVSHKTCPVQVREKLSFLEEILPQALSEIRLLEGMRECFILSTCNRVELYGHGGSSVAKLLAEFLVHFHGLYEEDLAPHIYQLKGEDMIRHLFRVACGLESMVVGEPEIYGQLKHAFRIASEAGTVDSVLYQLAERALRVGKKVRAETRIGRGAVSVPSVAVELAEKIFGKLNGETVLVLGAGEMGEKTLEHLTARGAGNISIASRSSERALELGRRFDAQPAALENWQTLLHSSDIVITSASSPQAFVTYEYVKQAMEGRCNRPLFLIDIAVPRNVEAKVETLDDVHLYDIDDLESVVQGNLRERKREIHECERLIEYEIDQFERWQEHLDLKPVLERVDGYFDRALEQEIKKPYFPFPGKERELREFFRRVKRKIFHNPLHHLKHASEEGTVPRYLQLLRKLFSDDTSSDLQKGRAQDQPKEKIGSP